ncbi:hypothetical protein ACOHYD_03755 [Desulfobacterota bacterium M19]
MRKFILFILFMSSAVLTASCSTISQRQSSAQVAVKKGAPVVYIHPLEPQAYAMSSVGILPFDLATGINPRLGTAAAGIFQDILLGREAFHRVKLLPEHYGNNDEALRAGKREKVDLVMAGRINYALEGTELGGSRLDISVRLLNTRTGKTIWHIEQAMEQPMDYPRTDILHSLINALQPPVIRRSKGAPVVVNMLARSADDIAEVMTGARYVRR